MKPFPIISITSADGDHDILASVVLPAEAHADWLLDEIAEVGARELGLRASVVRLWLSWELSPAAAVWATPVSLDGIAASIWAEVRDAFIEQPRQVA